MDPAVERAETDKGRDSGEGRKRHRQDRRIESRPGARHPVAAGQVMNQDKGYGAERKTEPEQIGAQPGAVEISDVDDRSDHAAGDANDQRG